MLTLPNALSGLRLLLVPLFVWLVLGLEADGWAVLVLMVSGLTDWADGRIARAWNQASKLGRLLDPVADRLFVVVTLLALAIRDIVPWWLVVVLFARDAVMAVVQATARLHGFGVVPVNVIGKAATACLLYALPLLLLTDGTGRAAEIIAPAAWAFTVWGLGLYWWSALLYAVQIRALSAGRRLVVDV